MMGGGHQKGIRAPRTQVFTLSPEADLCTRALGDQRGQEEGSFGHKLISQQPRSFHSCF